MTSRPALPLILSFLVGIALARSLSLSLPLILSALAGVGLLTGFLTWRGRLRAASACLLIFFALLGAVRLSHRIGVPSPTDLSHLPSSALPAPFLIRGMVAAPPEEIAGEDEEGGSRLRLVLQVERVGTGETALAASGRVRVSLLDAHRRYRYGEVIEGQFRLRRPRGYLNPAANTWVVGASKTGVYHGGEGGVADQTLSG